MRKQVFQQYAKKLIKDLLIMAAAWWIIINENARNRNNNLHIIRRQLRDTQNPFDVSETTFQRLYRLILLLLLYIIISIIIMFIICYNIIMNVDCIIDRLSREAVIQLCRDLSPFIPQGMRATAISLELKVTLCVVWFMQFLKYMY